MKKELLNETITLLERVQSEHGCTEDSMVKSLDQAIQNLVSMRDNEGMATGDGKTVLVILAKLLEHFPEIKELLQRLAGL